MRWRDIPPLKSPEHTAPPDHEPTHTCTEPPKEEIPKTSHYFTILLLTGYYTLTFPFKPVIDPKTNEYVFKSNALQKSLCYVSWTLSILNRVSSLRRTFTSTYTSHTTVSYFHLSHSLIHVFPYAIYFHTNLFNSASILRTLNSLHSSPLLTTSRFRNASLRYTLVTSQLVWLAVTLAASVIGYEVINSCCWTPETIGKAFLAHGRVTFFIRSSVSSTISENLTQFTAADKLVISSQILVTTSHVCLLFFIVCLFGNCGVTLWANVSGFYDAAMTHFSETPKSEDVESQVKSIPKPNLRTSYDHLRSVASSLNSTWHLLSFWYIMDLTAWLSTELDSGLRSNDYFLKAHMFYYLLYVGAAMCFSAEAFRKMEKLKSCARNCDKAKLIENGIESDVDHVLKCLDSEVVGIGEVGFFRINYAFIGQLTGLIITFYIISVGENTKREHDSMMMEQHKCADLCYVL